MFDSQKYHREYMRGYNQKPEYMEYRRKWMREWYRKNAKEIYARRRARPYEKMAAAVRARVYECLKKGYKSVKTEKLIGMTFKELKVYIEDRFKEGMTWENYGEWHIDHIIPISSFDLTKAENQKKAFHYTNLQPLWARENLQKHTKMVELSE